MFHKTKFLTNSKVDEEFVHDFQDYTDYTFARTDIV